MKITILVLSLVLVGCDGIITKYDLQKGEEFCSDKDGLSMYKSHDLNHRIKIVCNNHDSIALVAYNLKGTKK